MSLKQSLPPPPFQTPFILAPFGGFGSSPPVAKKFSPTPEKPQTGAGISFPWIEFISNQHNLVNGAAPLDSPELTGTPVAPTAAPGTSSTQVATTKYTDSAVAVEAARAETAEASNAAAIAAETSRAETSEANLAASVATETARAEAAEALLAPKNSPVFTGVVTAPVVEITNGTPTGGGTSLGLGNTTGIGAGALGAIQAPALGGGSGPATPGTIVKWLEIDLGGVKYWIPLAQ